MSERSIRHPVSPRDDTKVVAEGVLIDPELVTPIRSPRISPWPKDIEQTVSTSKSTPPDTVSTSKDTEQAVSTSKDTEQAVSTSKSTEQAVSTPPDTVSTSKDTEQAVSTPPDTVSTSKSKAKKPRRKKASKSKYDMMTEDQKIEMYEDYVVRFRILQKKHPSIVIEVPPYEKGLKHVASRYQSFLKLIYSNKKPCFYRNCLMISWLGIEIIGIKFGLDMAGYTMNQMSSLEDYEYLLIQLGENPYDSFAEEWSPMVRIAILSLINAAVFIVIKYLSGVIGPDMARQLQKMVSQLMSGSESKQEDNTGGMSSIISIVSSMLSGDNSVPPKDSTEGDILKGPKYKS